MTEPHDSCEQRCKRLGHPVTFGYCRTQERNTPCPEILNCWWQRFDVAACMRRTLAPDQFRALVDRPAKSKVEGLVELIEQARRARKNSSEGTK